MPPMSALKLEPEDTLYFCKTPATSSPNKILVLTNTSSGNVAFKVKTNAPKSCLVRPRSGTLKPRDNQQVEITLMPSSSDGAAKNHRFLVQAVNVEGLAPVSLQAWAAFPKDVIQEQDLNVVLEECNTEEVQGKTTPEVLPTNEVLKTTGDQPSDLKTKYDELVQYTLMLEKEKKKLEADMTKLVSEKKPGEVDGYTKFHLILVAVIVGFLSYAVKLLG
mmetsp:Transcript_28838/g.51355  ORF Transcript_28838/g.51355 Transcript_28838/m.51355 type:complete len:219 (-) Transcript_28838:204-860(-)